MISVIVTVGPDPAYKKYLTECLDSIQAQKVYEDGVEQPLEIVIVDDAAHLVALEEDPRYTYVKLPWHGGQVTAINWGVIAATYNLVFIMGGSDDKLLPGCIQACVDQMEKIGDRYACYHPILVTSEGEKSDLPQGPWLLDRERVFIPLGGYPVEAGVGEVDAIFCSVMLKQGVRMFKCGKEPLYWHREHPRALTATKSFLRHDAAELVRALCTREWEKPYWIKGYGYDF